MAYTNIHSSARHWSACMQIYLTLNLKYVFIILGPFRTAVIVICAV